MKGQIEPMTGVRVHVNTKGATIFRLHYSADPEKTPEWAAVVKKGMSDPAMYQQELEIDFGATGGALIYDYHPEATEEDEFVVPPHWTRYTSLDPHPVKPHAMLWVAVDPYGIGHVYREYWPSKVYGRPGPVPEMDNRVSIPTYVACVQFLESAENKQNGGVAEDIYRRYIDYAARAFGKGTSDDADAQPDFQTRFERAADDIDLDFRFVDAKKGHMVGFAIVNEWLKPVPTVDHVSGEVKLMSKLRIMRGRCPELVWQLRNNRRRKLTATQAENDDPLMRAIRKRNDLTDSLQYLLVGGCEYMDPNQHHADSWQPATAGINY